MSGLSALRRSGRFMVIVSKPDSRFCSTMSLLMCGAFVVVHLLLFRGDANGSGQMPALRIEPGTSRSFDVQVHIRVRADAPRDDACGVTSSPADSVKVRVTGTPHCRGRL